VELLEYQQDLSQKSHQEIPTMYYKAQSATIKITMLKNQVNLFTGLMRQDMIKSLSEGQFVSNAANHTANLQLYYNTYSSFPGKTANPHITASNNYTPYGTAEHEVGTSGLRSPLQFPRDGFRKHKHV
jgi:hypothetical protein